MRKCCTHQDPNPGKFSCEVRHFSLRDNSLAAIASNTCDRRVQSSEHRSILPLWASDWIDTTWVRSLNSSSVPRWPAYAGSHRWLVLRKKQLSIEPRSRRSLSATVKSTCNDSYTRRSLTTVKIDNSWVSPNDKLWNDCWTSTGVSIGSTAFEAATELLTCLLHPSHKF